MSKKKYNTFDEHIEALKEEKRKANKMASELVTIMRNAQTDLATPSMPKVWACMERKFKLRRVAIIDKIKLAGFNLDELKNMARQ